MSKVENKRLRLKNVRLSFPSIFKRANFDGNEGKFEATFLIPKSDKKTYDMLSSAIDAAIAEAKVKVPADKRCLKDGDDFEYDGYADHWAFKASSSKRPTILDKDKTPLVEDDGRPYAGCYVNASVDIWIQNNQYGKRANANLFGLQFLKDGEAFGAGDIDVTDDFDDVDEEDDL